MMRKRIGKIYEMYSAKVLSDSMAKKAVVLPTLIKLRSMIMILIRSSESRGMRSVG